MALKKCKGCGYKISRKTQACPSCGEPNKKKGSSAGIVLLLISVIIISTFVNNNKSSSNKNYKPVDEVLGATVLAERGKALNPEIDGSQRAEINKNEYIEQLNREIMGVADFDVSTYTDSVGSILICVALFSTWAAIAENGNSHSLDENEKALLNTFRSNVSKAQMKAFPKLRDAYGPEARKLLWENDLSAKTYGNRFTIIEFVGGTFAANRNIKTFHSGVLQTLMRLRFKQARYKWFKGADEYDYYNVSSNNDSDLI